MVSDISACIDFLNDVSRQESSVPSLQHLLLPKSEGLRTCLFGDPLSTASYPAWAALAGPLSAVSSKMTHHRQYTPWLIFIAARRLYWYRLEVIVRTVALATTTQGINNLRPGL